jgi:hypothetical protein
MIVTIGNMKGKNRVNRRVNVLVAIGLYPGQIIPTEVIGNTSLMTHVSRCVPALDVEKLITIQRIMSGTKTRTGLMTMNL